MLIVLARSRVAIAGLRCRSRCGTTAGCCWGCSWVVWIPLPSSRVPAAAAAAAASGCIASCPCELPLPSSLLPAAAAAVAEQLARSASCPCEPLVSSLLLHAACPASCHCEPPLPSLQLGETPSCRPCHLSPCLLFPPCRLCHDSGPCQWDAEDEVEQSMCLCLGLCCLSWWSLVAFPPACMVASVETLVSCRDGLALELVVEVLEEVDVVVVVVVVVLLDVLVDLRRAYLHLESALRACHCLPLRVSAFCWDADAVAAAACRACASAGACALWRFWPFSGLAAPLFCAWVSCLLACAAASAVSRCRPCPLCW